MDNKDNCLNCKHQMHGPICSHCGQKKAKPFQTKRIFQDFWSHILELDYKFIHTILGMLTEPGILINNYLYGKRIHYTNPFKFLFFVATAYFLVLHFFNVPNGFVGASKVQIETTKLITALLNYLVFLFLIPTALLFIVIFKKVKLNFAESYIACCYLWSGYLLIAIPFAIILNWLNHYNIFVRVFIGVVYLIISLRQMFKLRWSTSIIKTLLLFISYILSAILVMIIVVAISYLVKFEPLMILTQSTQN